MPVGRDDGVKDVVGYGLHPAQRVDRCLLHAQRTLHRSELGFEHDKVDRLGQVVVGAGIQPLDQIFVTVQCRQENDRCPSVDFHGLDAAGCFEAIHDRHHDVEQDQIRHFLRKTTHRFLAVLGDDDLVTELFEEHLQDVKIGAVVVYRKHLHRVLCHRHDSIMSSFEAKRGSRGKSPRGNRMIPYL